MLHIRELCLLLIWGLMVSNTNTRTLKTQNNYPQLWHSDRPISEFKTKHRSQIMVHKFHSAVSPKEMQGSHRIVNDLHLHRTPEEDLERLFSLHHPETLLRNRRNHHQHPLERKDGAKEGVVVCDICPDDTSIAPCTCNCHNTTVADIRCGPKLKDCPRLTAILNVATPISQYLRLVVKNTQLSCVLKNGMWGPTTFQEIILQDNRFTTVDNKAFIHFNNTLKILNLEKNCLQNVDFSTLSDQPLLEHLNLNSNKIKFLPGEGGIALYNLLKLRLYNNSLISIQANTFMYMPRLQLLDLSFNEISSIGREAFTFQNRLVNDHELFINLANNHIESIPNNMISGVENVTVSLQNNNLQALPEDRFMSIIKNTNYQAKILLTGNPIICDTDICWIVKNSTIVSSFDNFRCSNMPVNIRDLTVDTLGCSIDVPH